MLVIQIFEQARIIKVDFGVHDDSIHTDVFQYFFRVLKHLDSSAPFAVLRFQIINIFKRRDARLVMQVWLDNKNDVSNQLLAIHAVDTYQPSHLRHLCVPLVIRCHRKIFGYTQLVVVSRKYALQLFSKIKRVNCFVRYLTHAGRRLRDLLSTATLPFPTVLLLRF